MLVGCQQTPFSANTDLLRQRVRSEYPDIETAWLPEAEVFQRYLAHVYGLRADYLEIQSII